MHIQLPELVSLHPMPVGQVGSTKVHSTIIMLKKINKDINKYLEFQPLAFQMKKYCQKDILPLSKKYNFLLDKHGQ
jgi:hypothetical protein